MEIFANEQLGTERELLELLQVGAIAMAKVGGMVLENFQPSMAVFSLPYLFDSQESFWSVLNGEIGRQLLEETSRYGFKGLCYYDSGSRSFYTHDRPIRRPEDLKGLKIRVPNSATSIQMIRELGGSATPIAFGELYSALQQAVVDGAENNPPSLYFSRHFEVCRYYILDEHTRVPDVLLMSADTWKRLPPELQKIVEEAARDSVAYQRKLWDEAVEHSMSELRKAGVQVLKPDREPFVRATRPMLERYQSSAEYGDLIARIRAVQRK